MGARIGIGEAFGATYWSPSVLAAMGIGSAAALAGQMSGGLWKPIAAVLAIFFIGYTVSYARGIATGECTSLPSLRNPAHMRRGLAMGVVVFLPATSLFLLLLVGLLILSSAIPAINRIVGIQVLGIVWLVVLMFGEYVFGPRYVVTDRLRVSLWYLDAMRRVWRNRLAAAMLLGFAVASSFVFAAVERPLETLLGTSFSLVGITAQLHAGNFYADELLGLGAIVGLAAVSSYMELVTAHMLEQYARIAYESES